MTQKHRAAIDAMNAAAELKHTPGPWKVVTSGDGSFAIEDHAEVKIIAQRSAWPARICESDANARLIASAPDLLAACKEVYGWINQLPVPTTGCLSKMQVLHDAIAKAEGHRGKRG